jgi:hypothetical protein
MKRALVLGAALAAFGIGAQAQERGAQPPPGDYWQSCRNVSASGYGPNAVVTAQCRDNRGRWRETGLRFGGCRQIENQDGQLACVGGGGRPPPSREGGPGGPGGGRPPGGGHRLTLFATPGFNGPSYETRQEITNLPRRYNDRAMSLRIDGRRSWQVCSDSDFRGRCQVFDRDVPDLRPYGLSGTISSMRPVR